MSTIVSVVVPTFQRPVLLERCLEALLAQDFSSGAYEIVIVDDAASKGTHIQVEGWSRRAAEQGRLVRYLSTSGRCGPAVARNQGWQAASGTIIAFTDDDCVPEANWLSAGFAAFTDGVQAVSGRIRVPLTHKPTDYEYDASHLEGSEFATANCFYRRDILREVGGFDERFKLAWREDSDLYFSLLERAARCLRCEDALVIHPVRPARWGVSLFQQRKSMCNALLYKKHPRLYRERIQSTPPWQYYCATGALLVVILGILGQSWPFILAALAFWCLLTARFCLLRLQHTSHALPHVCEMLVTSAMIPPLAVFWRLRGMLVYRVFFL